MGLRGPGSDRLRRARVGAARVGTQREPPITDAAIRACLVGDEGFFRKLLHLWPWWDGPLVVNPRAGEHTAHVVRYRQRLLDAVAQVGGFSLAALDDGDPRALRKLEALYRKCGLDPGEYLTREEEADVEE